MKICLGCQKRKLACHDIYKDYEKERAKLDKAKERRGTTP